MKDALVPLHSSALIGIFREVLESSLIERGSRQGVELLGPVDEFWRGVPLTELRRMAEAGNMAAQGELAWRFAAGEGIARSYPQAVRWAAASAECACASGEAVLGWLRYNGFGLQKDHAEAARLF